MSVPGNAPDTAQTTTILAAGLNSFGQLPTANTTTTTRDDGSPFHHDNLYTFTPLSLPPSPEPCLPIFSSWSTTAFASRHALLLRTAGHPDMAPISLIDGLPRSPFGDHDGLVGFLNPAGELTVLESEAHTSPDPSARRPPALTPLASPDGFSPKLAHVALAGNARVALTFRQAPNGNLCHCLEFAALPAFRDWYRDPSGGAEGAQPLAHHMQQGRPRQLLATAAGFLMLMEDGGVHSWGDGRYASLGRKIAGEGAVPAETPGVIPALEGLRISKIATGTGTGWMAAALDAGNKAAYVWGRVARGGAEKEISFLAGLEVGGVYCVEIVDGEGGEAMDVLDIGVGNGFVVVLVESGVGKRQVFGAGDNSRGQLGLGRDVEFAETWTRVPGIGGDVKEVVCGSHATFLIS